MTLKLKSLIFVALFLLGGCSTLGGINEFFSDAREKVTKLQVEIIGRVIPVVETLCASEQFMKKCSDEGMEDRLTKLKANLAKLAKAVDSESEVSVQVKYDELKASVEKIKEILKL